MKIGLFSIVLCYFKTNLLIYRRLSYNIKEEIMGVEVRGISTVAKGKEQLEQAGTSVEVQEKVEAKTKRISHPAFQLWNRVGRI